MMHKHFSDKKLLDTTAEAADADATQTCARTSVTRKRVRGGD